MDILDLYNMPNQPYTDSSEFSLGRMRSYTGYTAYKKGESAYYMVDLTFTEKFTFQGFKFDVIKDTGDMWYTTYDENGKMLNNRYTSGNTKVDNEVIHRLVIAWNLNGYGFTQRNITVSNLKIFGEFGSPVLISIDDKLYTAKNNSISMVNSDLDISPAFMSEHGFFLSTLIVPIVIEGRRTTLGNELNKMTDKYKIVTIK